MKIAIRREPIEGERRVAATPAAVAQYVAAGYAVTVQKGAGVAAGYPDSAYAEAGAELAASIPLSKVDVLAHVRPLDRETIAKLPKGAITVGFASPASELDAVKALADRGVTAFSLELIPRISRAQSMDALTSQALVAGYRCVLEASMRFPRFLPLFMTAAGTIPPARVLVLGAGVAGLQAIATAKRLGAKVSAYDVRSASADEVQSMGGTFIHLDLDAAADAAGGYAKELAADRADRQRELLAPYVADADIIITTAAIPGRPAPRLVTASMVKGMAAGSIIVDLAAETGGNVEGATPGEDVQVPVDGGHVTIVGMKDAASTMPYDASRLLGQNIANLVALMTRDGALVPDFDDEVVAGACLTHEGAVRHEPTAAALADRKGGK
ncbi:Re/Si-specific NAD(P)(+) transhydrogenase subunit alpha [Microcella frigidaquae]|uniref:proton-translocating NAD(P)(+) transhydrogenase n=1 Tax=Microcella frigidaquae TaxID=424758 RepID=A0A840X7A6_9MICO|nr:Re/Si-specific NAD(P)(+) transhydrogenase subunit alpha [Microcella frigidaquae]MBB5618433.1 NAD(P) transhydrogenase subunit alpha [Microcella frigidaquae]NHN44665.1 Re/Si-specific NAD(P)(+) transhydrogenase subunit alpha [Microcella frigidaquae]